MGSSSSSPIGAQTHDQAFKGTTDTRMIMDELLNYMIKQLSVRDLLHMSKESECKKYVLFKANAIYQYFHELRIFPTTDTKGLLTFRRVEDLVNPKGEQEKERQSLCLIIAYFYTRIFQIYGALALTLIDDMNAMTSSGIMTTFKKGNNMRGQTPGYYAQTPYYGRGGAELLDPSKYSALSSTVKLQNFEWIRSLLTANLESSIGYKTRYAGTGENKGIVFIKIDETLRVEPKGKPIPSGTPPVNLYQDATCYIRVEGVDKYNTLDFYTLNSSGNIRVKISKLTFNNREGETITVDKFDQFFSIESRSKNGNQIYFIKDKPEEEAFAYMANILSEIIVYLKYATKEQKDNIYDRGDYKRARATYNYGSNRGIRSTISPKSEEGITSHLKVERMIDALSTRRPLGHCIARALQLLKTEPLANQPGISQICSLAFDGKGTKTNRIGLPKSDEKLSEHPGLFALANLFYDTIIIGSPNLVIGKNKVDRQPSTFQEYVAFMTTLHDQYAMGTKPLTPQEMEEKGLSGIVNKRDGKVCASADEIPLSLKTTEKVHEIVKSMFDMQVKHAKDCYKIINMLFAITIHPTTGKPAMFKLNDNLISKGFPELERINREARIILVKYYTDCENKYTKGMGFIWTEKDDEQKEKAARSKEALEKEQAEKAAREAAEAAAEAAKVEAEAQIKKEAEARRIKQIQEQMPKSQAVSRQLIEQAALRRAQIKKERENNDRKEKIRKFTMRPVGKRSIQRNTLRKM